MQHSDLLSDKRRDVLPCRRQLARVRDRIETDHNLRLRGGTMETITLHSRVGADGLLSLQVPVKLTNTDLEVVLIAQPVAPQPNAYASHCTSLVFSDTILDSINWRRLLSFRPWHLTGASGPGGSYRQLFLSL
jgi:hypothetical protein